VGYFTRIRQRCSRRSADSSIHGFLLEARSHRYPKVLRFINSPWSDAQWQEFRTDSIISTLIVYAINTGLATSIVATICVFCVSFSFTTSDKDSFAVVRIHAYQFHLAKFLLDSGETLCQQLARQVSSISDNASPSWTNRIVSTRERHYAVRALVKKLLSYRYRRCTADLRWRVHLDHPCLIKW
jgi:hypothetical protein